MGKTAKETYGLLKVAFTDELNANQQHFNRTYIQKMVENYVKKTIILDHMSIKKSIQASVGAVKLTTI